MRWPGDFDNIRDKHTESGWAFHISDEPKSYFRNDVSDEFLEELIEVAQAEIDDGAGKLQAHGTWIVEAKAWIGDGGFDEGRKRTSWFAVILANDGKLVSMYPIPEKK